MCRLLLSVFIITFPSPVVGINLFLAALLLLPYRQCALMHALPLSVFVSISGSSSFPVSSRPCSRVRLFRSLPIALALASPLSRPVPIFSSCSLRKAEHVSTQFFFPTRQWQASFFVRCPSPRSSPPREQQKAPFVINQHSSSTKTNAG
ncbi:hypothetical protein BGZ61DRAFT_53846 [Ilyonectria robusta]|uniref:uncharacterized protein n=1 Tax=Ilyonectria robusta TaxID=1079257 RepID=UPI001E8CB94E|nr:uncharacterized protein BGZ61DRAFT_53846 [Ilyonectria robusta]KAH8686581.1 hypothetical protein BGZ61DRAFT_53846 [Ilyonectria robusta]